MTAAVADSRSGDHASGEKRGVDVLLDFLETNGFEYVFGNPGTFEQGFVEALSRRPRIEYILDYMSWLRLRWLMAMRVRAAALPS